MEGKPHALHNDSVCVSINPFLTGTRTTLAENVITLLSGRCSVACCCGGFTWLVIETHVCLLPQPTNIFVTRVSPRQIAEEEFMCDFFFLCCFFFFFKLNVSQLIMTE